MLQHAKQQKYIVYCWKLLFNHGLHGVAGHSSGAGTVSKMDYASY